jgi:DNA replicative helicase MCM subunit Mcm2 (Cdc46/Mcm family)
MNTRSCITECGNCGAEYVVRYDDDQFGIGTEYPTFCPFCGTELDKFFVEDNMEELNFEED